MTRPPKNKLIKIAISDKKQLARQIKIIAELLNNKKIIILPARTMYGLSARFDMPEAVNKIYEIKRRPKELPFIILISDYNMLARLVADVSDNAKKLINLFWTRENPQSLTMVFKKNLQLPDMTGSFRDTIAVRMAEFDFVRKIIDRSAPLISTSANLSGSKKNPLEIEHIPDKILDNIDMVIEYEQKLLGIQSTIIDVSDKSGTVRLIRQGVVPFKEILQKTQIKI